MQGSSSDSATFSNARHLISPSSWRQVGHRFCTRILQVEQSVCPFRHCRSHTFVRIFGIFNSSIIMRFQKTDKSSIRQTEQIFKDDFSKMKYYLHPSSRLTLSRGTGRKITHYIHIHTPEACNWNELIP